MQGSLLADIIPAEKQTNNWLYVHQNRLQWQVAAPSPHWRRDFRRGCGCGERGQRLATTGFSDAHMARSIRLRENVVADGAAFAVELDGGGHDLGLAEE